MTWMPMPFPRQFFVLGSEKGIALIDSSNDVEGLIVDIKKEVSVSRNMGSI
jgi:hypothetical protein